MYGHHIITHSKTKDQPGKAIPARFQLNRENEYISLSPSAPENLVSQDGYGSPVPRQPAHLRTRAQSGAYLRDSSRVPRRRLFIHLNRHTPSDQSQVHQVTQLRTDGVHCRETTGTGPVNFKVVQVTGTAFASPDQFICASLSHAQCWHEVGTTCLCKSSLAHLGHPMKRKKKRPNVLTFFSPDCAGRSEGLGAFDLSLNSQKFTEL